MLLDEYGLEHEIERIVSTGIEFQAWLDEQRKSQNKICSLAEYKRSTCLKIRHVDGKITVTNNGTMILRNSFCDN